MRRQLNISQSLDIARELSIGNAPPEYRRRLADDIRRVIGDKPTNIVAVDHGGLKQFEINKLYLGFSDTQIKLGNTAENLRYAGVIWPFPVPDPKMFGLRRIQYLSTEFKLSNREVLLIMDDVSTVPRPTTTMSALNAMLQDFKDSFEKAYVAVTTDRSGFPNFVAVRLGTPLGPIKYTSLYERELYNRWEKTGFFPLIGTEVSPYDDTSLIDIRYAVYPPTSSKLGQRGAVRV